jgi:hypothetical protein
MAPCAPMHANVARWHRLPRTTHPAPCTHKPTHGCMHPHPRPQAKPHVVTDASSSDALLSSLPTESLSAMAALLRKLGIVGGTKDGVLGAGGVEGIRVAAQPAPLLNPCMLTSAYTNQTRACSSLPRAKQTRAAACTARCLCSLRRSGHPRRSRERSWRRS